MIPDVPSLSALLNTAGDVLSVRDTDIDFESEPVTAAQLAALGIHREIGTCNDQLTKQTYAVDTNEPVPLECAKSEVIEFRGHVGVRIRYEKHVRLKVLIPDFVRFLHPSLSFNSDGTIRELVVFPLSVARIALLEDAKLVIVPRWALEMSLAKVPVSMEYYKCLASRDGWTRVPNGVLNFCRLIEGRQLPFFTTHDLASHIVGFKRSMWDPLVDIASRLRHSLQGLFAELEVPPIHTLILPFVAGYLLDSLAQPSPKNRHNILTVVPLLIDAIDRRTIGVSRMGELRRFPRNYGRLVALTLSSQNMEPAVAQRIIDGLIDEVNSDLET